MLQPLYTKNVSGNGRAFLKNVDSGGVTEYLTRPNFSARLRVTLGKLGATSVQTARFRKQKKMGTFSQE